MEKIEEILSEFTHELKSPLSKIKALSVLIKNTDDIKVINSKITAIEQCADVVNDKVEILLEYLIIEHSKNKLQVSIFKLEELFAELTKKFIFNVKGQLNIEMIGEYERITKALCLILSQDRETASFDILTDSVAKGIRITIHKKLKKNAFYNSPKKSMREVLAEKIFSRNGGNMETKEMKNSVLYKISLPIKPKIKKQ